MLYIHTPPSCGFATKQAAHKSRSKTTASSPTALSTVQHAKPTANSPAGPTPPVLQSCSAGEVTLAACTLRCIPLPLSLGLLQPLVLAGSPTNCWCLCPACQSVTFCQSQATQQSLAQSTGGAARWVTGPLQLHTLPCPGSQTVHRHTTHNTCKLLSKSSRHVVSARKQCLKR